MLFDRIPWIGTSKSPGVGRFCIGQGLDMGLKASNITT
jgi:hypothetical protein